MEQLPLFASLTGRSCLIVGGGRVAARRLELVRKAGARVTVVAEAISDDVRRLADAEVVLVERAFADADTEGQRLVIAATNDRAVNRAVFEAAERRGIWINTVDDPTLCSVIFPAIVDRSPVVVAVATGGASPTLSRLLRMRIEAALPDETGALAAASRRVRRRVAALLPDAAARRRLWDRLLDGAGARRFLADPESALAAAAAAGAVAGEVLLVGAGPGDPDLLTLKAARALSRADVVLYDNLVSPAVLDRVRRDARKIYVGKRRSFHAMRQTAINELLVREARQGNCVVRLKGGDPFIFGRGGEEIETLAADGIDVEVIPGITAAAGAAAYVGIPLTHRDWAQSVRFVTGHLKDGTVNLDWPELARSDQTLVVYMGLTGLPQIAARLVEHGLPADTPAALVARATLPDQRVVVSTIAALAGDVAAAEVTGPTTIIIGRVVAFVAKNRHSGGSG